MDQRSCLARTSRYGLITTPLCCSAQCRVVVFEFDDACDADDVDAGMVDVVAFEEPLSAEAPAPSPAGRGCDVPRQRRHLDTG